jgi:uncharacterized membrane protein
MEQKSLFARWRSNFLTGLVLILPAVISFAVIKWLFGTISSITDLLLFFLPKTVTHESDGTGPIRWYWSLIALLLAILIISFVGRLARNYFGKKMIEWMDAAMLRIPLFNKIYAAIKQVNEAFAGNKHSFKTVVLVEFPGPGNYSMGFITNEQQGEVQKQSGKNLITIFIPTTPNPTSGFLVLVPEEKIKKLDMSVADGIKYIVSLGSLSPEYLPPKIK